ncbi:hypothetical protein [Flagellimonas onchidii]|uniref:hypothetical protein n=1 Tax=Flagellimonas onchidii TaxID=2562684 RepID=UPI0010A5FB65|nr:hypothetical protein [Allomuricauda onchidii]
MKKSLARIHVQQSFCIYCAERIEKELLCVDDISNVYTYPVESLVVFQFARANELSMALNKLMELGYPPKGDVIKEENYVPPLCSCEKVGYSAA